MTLYEECVEALKDNYTILGNNDKNRILTQLENKFLFTNYGRIDWDRVIKKEQVNDNLDIIEELVRNNTKVYIIWDEETLPVIKSDLFTVINAIDDITAVSFDTWIFSADKEFVIEFYHDGEIKIGFSQ
ncbi:hypothetical protein [Clostridium sporogenes]|uniref:CDI toxin immunity protein n=1 Tax=Clostridium sporogenes TaxID=1509 RepID=UPI0013D28E39|nr:hypothetical protein [Clostridium sporogenes]NFP90988.1 hypothetical protein [Clostridium sporogenes]